jgi:phospholipid/cholesterol/gamma-HCH transport system substrate-binding protein
MTVVGDFKGASAEFESTLGDLGSLVDTVKAGEGTLGRLLVGEELADSLQQTISNLQTFSDDLASGKGTLGKLVTDDSLYLELQSMLSKADQALDSVGDSGPITAVGALSGALF